MADDTPRSYIGMILPHGRPSERALTIFEHVWRACERNPIPEGGQEPRGAIDPKETFTVCNLADAADHRVEDVRSIELPPGGSRTEWTYP